MKAQEYIPIKKIKGNNQIDLLKTDSIENAILSNMNNEIKERDIINATKCWELLDKIRNSNLEFKRKESNFENELKRNNWNHIFYKIVRVLALAVIIIGVYTILEKGNSNGIYLVSIGFATSQIRTINIIKHLLEIKNKLKTNLNNLDFQN